MRISYHHLFTSLLDLLNFCLGKSLDFFQVLLHPAVELLQYLAVSGAYGTVSCFVPIVKSYVDCNYAGGPEPGNIRGIDTFGSQLLS